MSTTEMTAVGPSTTLTLVRPVSTAKALIELHEEITIMIRDALTEDVDYGTLPGTDEKVLYKAGAERVCIAFACSPRYDVVGSEIDHDRKVEWRKRKKQWDNPHGRGGPFKWVVEEGESLGLYRYVVRCRIEQHGGRIVAEGLASCSTMESKYIDRPRDCENTALKMAEKRAFVAATLNAFGLSDRFTQDMEEDEARGDRDRDDDTPRAPTLNDRLRQAHALMHDAGIKDTLRPMWIGELIGRKIENLKQLSMADVDRVIAHLQTVDAIGGKLTEAGIKGPAKLTWMQDQVGRKASPRELTEAEAVKLLALATAAAAPATPAVAPAPPAATPPPAEQKP